MRYKIAEHGIGDRDESWFYVEYDAAKDEAYWVHEWHNLSVSLQANEGERRVALGDAGNERYYSKAIEVLKEKHPEWHGFKAR